MSLSRASAERSLLWAALAAEENVVSSDVLIAALDSWGGNSSLETRLLDLRLIDAPQKAAIDARVDAQWAQQRADVRACLGSVTVPPLLRQRLDALMRVLDADSPSQGSSAENTLYDTGMANDPYVTLMRAFAPPAPAALPPAAPPVDPASTVYSTFMPPQPDSTGDTAVAASAITGIAAEGTSSTLGSDRTEVDPFATIADSGPIVRTDSAGGDQTERDPNATTVEGLQASNYLAMGRPSIPPSSGEGWSNTATRFRIVRAHAKGGLGEVFIARDQELQREVALKEIQDRHADNVESRARFVLEAEVTGGLEHPGVVPVYALGQYADGRPFYAMRFIRGESLKEAIERFHLADMQLRRDPGERALELRTLLSRFNVVCEAIAYAHVRGVIHRDLKPANVMLGKYGEVFVVDWGLAKPLGKIHEASVRTSVLGPVPVSGEETLADAPTVPSGSPPRDPWEEPLMPSSVLQAGSETLAGSAMGTPQFMSPEQAEGRLDEIGPASDIYSLGATLYTLLTGKPAIQDRDVRLILMKVRKGDFPPPRKVNPLVPRPLEAICLKAMALNPNDRYRSAKALAEDIEHWMADEPVSAYSEGWSQRLARWARRHRTWVQAGVAALLVVAVVSTVATVIVQGARRAERIARDREDAQRRRAEALAEADRREEAAARNEAEGLILKGQASVSGGDWAGAKLHLTSALSTLGDRPALASLRATATQLLAETERRLVDAEARQRSRATFAQFRRERDDALYYGMQLAGVDLATNVQAGRKACLKALALAGLATDLGTPTKLGTADLNLEHLTEAERTALADDVHEVLLVLAEVEGTALLGEPQTTRNEKARRALQLVDRAMELGPPAGADLRQHGHWLAALGDEKGALADNQRADGIPPKTAIDHFLIGIERFKRSQFEKAIPAFDAALRLDAEHFWAQVLLAASHLNLHHFAEGKAHLAACIARRPAFIASYLLRGYASTELGYFPDALADYDAAEKLNPNRDDRYALENNRGLVHFRQGDSPGAIALYERASALMPDQYAAFVNLAHVYQEKKQYDDALRFMNQAIEKAPQLASLYRDRARLQRDRGDLNAALTDFDQARSHEPADSANVADDFFESGLILFNQGRHEQSLSAIEAALKLRPKDPTILRAQAETLMKLGKYADAVKACDLALVHGRRSADVFRTRGEARQRLGDSVNAVADFTRALELEPKQPGLLTRRGWSLIVMEAWPAALADFEQAVQDDKNDGDAYNGRAYSAVKLKQYRKAVVDAEEAARRTPEFAEMWYNLACVFALAVDQVSHDPNEPARDPKVAQFRTRACELIEKALVTLPENQRILFWKQKIEPDADVEAIRRSDEFLRLKAKLKL